MTLQSVYLFDMVLLYRAPPNGYIKLFSQWSPLLLKVRVFSTEFIASLLVTPFIAIVINSSEVTSSSDSCNDRQAAEADPLCNSTDTIASTYAAKVGLKHAYIRSHCI